MTDNILLLIIISMAGIGLIITGFILLQVRNKNKLLQKQKQLSEAEMVYQKELLQAVITSQEAERQRIGNDLHDEVGSVLSSLRMLIESKYGSNDSQDSVFVSQSKTMIDGIIKNVRQISHNLSPHMEGKYGFYDALHGLCDTVNTSGRIRVVLNLAEQQLPQDTSNAIVMALYRVVAELINNTLKHAFAKNIVIDIQMQHNLLELLYKDDGIGFSPRPGMVSNGMGLRNIESRLAMIGARWKIVGGKTGGFEISISVVLKQGL